MIRPVLFCLGCFLLLPSATEAGLKISSLGTLDKSVSARADASGSKRKWKGVVDRLGADADRVVIKQMAADLGGTTSARNNDPLVWKTKGYYQRNRDLGQTFTASETFTLDALVLRTGPSEKAFLSGMPNAPMFVQFFEVEGQPVINDNGTPLGKKATHGFSTNHRCDDFIDGVTYRSIRVITGGVMPNLLEAGDGRLTYLKWDLTGDDELTFQKGRRYAFMVGIEQPGELRAFTLANRNNASSPAPPRLVDPNDSHAGGWGLRREGNGQQRTAIDQEAEPEREAIRQKLKSESFFPPAEQRYAIPPTCDGYPDVDTYRDLEFYLIGG